MIYSSSLVTYYKNATSSTTYGLLILIARKEELTLELLWILRSLSWALRSSPFSLIMDSLCCIKGPVVTVVKVPYFLKPTLLKSVSFIKVNGLPSLTFSKVDSARSSLCILLKFWLILSTSSFTISFGVTSCCIECGLFTVGVTSSYCYNFSCISFSAKISLTLIKSSLFCKISASLISLL